MDNNFLKELQQNSTPREDFLRKQRKLELEKQQKLKIENEVREKEIAEKFRIETDKIYDEFVDMIKGICIEAAQKGLFITRNEKNEIHGFIAYFSNYHLTYDYSYYSYNLGCYIKEFSNYNLFRKPIFKYDLSKSLHKIIAITDKIYKRQEEKQYLISYIKRYIDNIEFSKEFEYKCAPRRRDGNYIVDTSLNKIDFIMKF